MVRIRAPPKTSKSLILTRKELAVIKKKLENKKLNQQDSNYLSRYIRPKLREIKSIDATKLLEKLKYNQKIPAIEKKITNIILGEIKGVDSVTLYGSAIQTNYKKYNDIDVLIILKKESWKKTSEKYKMILGIKEAATRQSLNLDIEIYDRKTFQKFYPANISLIYQLCDKKTIYGKLSLPLKIEISKLNLRMKIDYSVLEDDYSGLEIYKAIRNLIIVELISQKIINNYILRESINNEVGKHIVEKLKTDSASDVYRKIGILHLNRLLKRVLKRIQQSKWERIELSNH